MEDLNAVKSWELKMRKELEDLKRRKESVKSDGSVPKAVKERFIEVMRSLKMTMIQVMSKCSQLRSESLPPKALKVRIEKVKSEYDEVKNSICQLIQTLDSKPASSLPRSSRTPSRTSQTLSQDEIPSATTKELDYICSIIEKAHEQLSEHKHSAYEQRMEVLEAENQELRRNLARIQSENSEVFEIITMLRARLDKLEGESSKEKTQDRESNMPRRRVLLQPSSHAEELMRVNY